jgi:diketogulonate reductase-like aldo/keto reductase
MTMRFVLNTGKHISWLAFGTGTALFGKDAANLVRQAIQHGVTHLDGAQMYRNEESLGAGIKASEKSRSELFITTKLNGEAIQPGVAIKDTLKDSLAKLGTEYVDLFLIHDPTQATKESSSKLADWWKQLEQLHSEGLARSIGVSNFNVENLKIVLESGTVVPAVNQVSVRSA